MSQIVGNGLSIRQLIKQQPVAEQLDFAIYMLEEMMGVEDGALAWWQKTYGLTGSEAKLAAVLNARAPNYVTRESLLFALGTDADIKIVDVFLCKLRKKVPFEITTIWGHGYSMVQHIDVPKSAINHSFTRALRGLPWTEQADEDLRVMFQSGSDVSVMAEELDRTERGIIDRITLLGLRGHKGAQAAS